MRVYVQADIVSGNNLQIIAAEDLLNREKWVFLCFLFFLCQSIWLGDPWPSVLSVTSSKWNEKTSIPLDESSHSSLHLCPLIAPCVCLKEKSMSQKKRGKTQRAQSLTLPLALLCPEKVQRENLCTPLLFKVCSESVAVVCAPRTWPRDEGMEQFGCGAFRRSKNGLLQFFFPTSHISNL